MADSNRRLQYYKGQFLQKEDFIEEQAYHLDRLRGHLRQLHTFGIAEGLTVTANAGDSSATVQPGTAIDNEGRPIVLIAPRIVPFGTLVSQRVLVVISYRQRSAVPATLGDQGDTRWVEDPDVELIPESGAPPADVRIRLALLQLDESGRISQHDTAVRTSAGPKLGAEIAIERVRLMRQESASDLWPVLSSGAPNQADVSGNLSVSGDLFVTGVVDGRDVSADGQKLDTHTASTNNPHNTTAEQVGALTGVGGISNPGGPVSLLAGNNILITPNLTKKEITIASATIGGISSPGGNIDLIGENGIVITGNKTTKKITFSIDSAVQEALPRGAYLKRALKPVVFSDLDDNGVIRTVDIGFQPKLISMEGTFTVQGDDPGLLPIMQKLGGSLGGFCVIDNEGGIHQSGHGPVISRLFVNSGDFNHLLFNKYSEHVEGSLCHMECAYAAGSLVYYVFADISINASSPGGFSVRLAKDSPPQGGNEQPASFTASMTFAVLG